MGGRMRKKAGCQWKRRSHRSVPGPLSASGVGRRSNLVPHPVHTALIRSIGPAPKISVQASPPKAAAAVPWGCAGRAGLPWLARLHSLQRHALLAPRPPARRTGPDPLPASQPARASRFQSPPLSRRWRLTAFGARQSGQRRYRSRLSLAIVTDLRESGTCLGGAPFCVRNVHCTMRRPSHLRHSTCILYSEAQHAEPKRREWPAALAAFPPVAPLVTATTPRAHHRQQP